MWLATVMGARMSIKCVGASGRAVRYNTAKDAKNIDGAADCERGGVCAALSRG